jgi:hypothetical protein
VNLSLGLGHAGENRDRPGLYPGGQLASRNKLLDLAKIPTVIVRMLVMVFMMMVVGVFMVVGVGVLVFMRVLVVVVMVVPMIVVVFVMIVLVVMVVGDVNVKLRAGDGGSLLAGNVEMVAVELEFAEFAVEAARVDTEVDQGADEHVAGDAAEDVKVESFHFVKPVN